MFKFKIGTGMNWDMHWDQDGRRGEMHWRKTPRGRNCWPICTIFNDTHKTRGKSFVYDMITLAHPWRLLKTLLHIYPYSPSLPPCSL